MSVQLKNKSITLSHGSGGKAMKDLIDTLFVNTFANSELAKLEDQARFDLSDLEKLGSRLAFSTDSYVIDPIFFPGGDIGSLAVHGTVNDIAVSGATPLYISLGMIIEEGFPIADLEAITRSIKKAADSASVKVVTGDTKVVEKGACDKLFINTTGIGVIKENLDISIKNARVGDKVIINGSIGDHGAAIVGARQDLALENTLLSDSQPLNELVRAMTNVTPEIHSMRDATRGGLASVLNEIAAASNISIKIKEEAIPIKEEVRGVCEILGLDPLYLANEGKLVTFVPSTLADQTLNAMRKVSGGEEATIIGEVIDAPAPDTAVILETIFGGQRMVDMLVGEQLPRIC